MEEKLFQHLFDDMIDLLTHERVTSSLLLFFFLFLASIPSSFVVVVAAFDSIENFFFWTVELSWFDGIAWP